MTASPTPHTDRSDRSPRTAAHPIPQPGTGTGTDTDTDEHVGEAADRLARRPWPAIPIRSDLEISFEFFPPANPSGADRLEECAIELAGLEPSFVSVTYGAGGSSRDRTLDALRRLDETTDLELAGHLTTVAASKGETLDMVDRYLDLGVERIVALRGDEPADHPESGTGSGSTTGSSDEPGFETAADLVAGIRDRVGDRVDISVAAYPEVHPRAASADSDLDNLKRKIDAGADRAITQFFFDNDAFLRFHDRCRSAGISVPIVAGIMPVGSFTKISSFAERCGTRIPGWMPDLFADLDDAPEIHQLVAATVAAEQCRELAERGVRHFHFYTMNRPALTAAVCRILGVRPGRTTSAAAGSDRRLAAGA